MLEGEGWAASAGGDLEGEGRGLQRCWIRGSPIHRRMEMGDPERELL
jgi:hypothetical protein